MHAPRLIPFWHLLVNDSSARRHPLNIASADNTAVADTVAMLNGSRQHVGDSLNSAVRMPGESSQIVLWNIIPEIIEQEKRIEFLGIAKSKSATKMYARTFERGLRFDELTGRIDIRVSP